jgi:hypothetical protein
MGARPRRRSPGKEIRSPRGPAREGATTRPETGILPGVDLVVRRPYPSIDAWLREEAHLFSAERAWLVGVDAPPGTTATLTIGLKGDDPVLEATVLVEGVAGDFKGQPLLSVRWVDLDAGAIETLQSLLRVDFSAIPSAGELVLPPLSSASNGAAALGSEPVVDLDGLADSVRSEQQPLPSAAAPAPVPPTVYVVPDSSPPVMSGSDTLDRLRARTIPADAKRAILTRGRQLRGRPVETR